MNHSLTKILLCAIATISLFILGCTGGGQYSGTGIQDDNGSHSSDIDDVGPAGSGKGGGGRS